MPLKVRNGSNKGSHGPAYQPVNKVSQLNICPRWPQVSPRSAQGQPEVQSKSSTGWEKDQPQESSSSQELKTSSLTPGEHEGRAEMGNRKSYFQRESWKTSAWYTNNLEIVPGSEPLCEHLVIRKGKEKQRKMGGAQVVQGDQTTSLKYPRLTQQELQRFLPDQETKWMPKFKQTKKKKHILGHTLTLPSAMLKWRNSWKTQNIFLYIPVNRVTQYGI